MAKFFMPPIKAVGVSAQEPLHPGNQIGLGRLEDKMKVIVHQAIGLHLATGLAAGLSHSLKKPLAGAVILKEGFASIPAIHHMINRSGILNSKFSGDSRKLSPPTDMSIPLTDPEAGETRVSGFADSFRL